MALAAVALIVVAWAPALVAQRYAGGPGGAEVGIARADQGWEFLYHAVRLSRGTRLGSADAALDTAREVWGGPPAVAEDVELTYLDGPFAAPVPPGGARPAAGAEVVRPSSRLGWVVTGSVRGGPPQMIGLLDYRSGLVVWDVRRPVPRRAA